VCADACVSACVRACIDMRANRNETKRKTQVYACMRQDGRVFLVPHSPPSTSHPSDTASPLRTGSAPPTPDIERRGGSHVAHLVAVRTWITTDGGKGGGRGKKGTCVVWGRVSSLTDALVSVGYDGVCVCVCSCVRVCVCVGVWVCVCAFADLMHC